MDQTFSESSTRKTLEEFSEGSRRQLSLFLVGSFTFIVSFSWNAFIQNVFQASVPANLKNSTLALLMIQLLYTLLVTFIAAIVIAFVNSRNQRVSDKNSLNACCTKIHDDVEFIRTRLQSR